MGWHIQPTRATARHFPDAVSSDDEAKFAAREEPDILAQIDLQADGRGYIHATMSRCDGMASPSIWRDLARELRKWGVRVIDWEHNGKDSSRGADRAWPDTVAMDR